MQCPGCGVGLTGPTVHELAETLRRDDVLADRMRTQLMVVPVPSPALVPAHPADGRGPAGGSPRRSWFAGRSVGVILLVLGALCVLAAGVVFVAVTWVVLPLAIRTLILILVTAAFGVFAHLALRRGLQATAEVMAVVASGMVVLGLVAARRAGPLGLAELAAGQYQVVAGAVLAAGTAVVFSGVVRLDSDGYAVSTVLLTVFASMLYVAWQRCRFPVAMVGAAVLGAITWSAAVGIGAGRAAGSGTDLARLASA